MPRVFALRRGTPAPQQSTSTTCGSSCLVVARMMADPAYAERVAARGFEAEELAVRNRTSGLLALLLRLRLPWPRALGTPPWSAAVELRRALGLPLGSVRWRVVRRATPEERASLVARLSTSLTREGTALLYVGGILLPRHVTLLLPAADGVGIDVYEPSAGQVLELDTEAFVDGRVDLGGWRRPWIVVAHKEVLG